MPDVVRKRLASKGREAFEWGVPYARLDSQPTLAQRMFVLCDSLPKVVSMSMLLLWPMNERCRFCEKRKCVRCSPVGSEPPQPRSENIYR